LFNSQGQAEINTSVKKYLDNMQTVAHSPPELCKDLHVLRLSGAQRIVHKLKKPEPEGSGCPVGCVPG